METLKNEEVQVTPGMTFTYRKADIQGLTDPVHTTTAALGVAGATTVTTAVRLIQASPSASIAGIQLIPIQTLEALLQQQQQQHLQGRSNKEHKVKGRMTPYAFFVQERREQYRRQGMDVNFTLFSKECSQLWKGMGTEEKQRYHILAEEDRDRYQKEMVGISCAKPLAKDGTRRGRKKKEPGQPKRNMCAFLHFCSEKRPKLKQDNPTATVGGMAKQLSMTWKEMTTDERRPYESLAERDKERYEQQKQAYEAGYLAAMSKREFASPMQPGIMLPQMVLKPPRQKRRRKDPDMPKRNMSAFMFFSLERRPKIKMANPDFGLAKLSKALSVEWLSMSEESKRPYVAIALRDKERYATELRAYKMGSYVRSESAHSLPVTPTCSEPHHSGTEKDPDEGESILDADDDLDLDEDEDEEDDDDDDDDDDDEDGGGDSKKALVGLSPEPVDAKMYQQLRELYRQ